MEILYESATTAITNTCKRICRPITYFRTQLTTCKIVKTCALRQKNDAAVPKASGVPEASKEKTMLGKIRVRVRREHELWMTQKDMNVLNIKIYRLAEKMFLKRIVKYESKYIQDKVHVVFVLRHILLN